MKKRLGIIAGNGDLPLIIATRAKSDGRDPFVLCIDGEADKRLTDYPHSYIKFGEVGKLFKSLSKHNVKDVVFAGGVTRPDFKQIKFDMTAVKNLPFIIGLLVGGDNQLLSGILSKFEEKGFHIVGAHEVAPSILAPMGVLGRHKADEAALVDIDKGGHIIAALDQFDVGQGVVVANQHVLAIEAAEGTDAMLERCAGLQKSGRLWFKGKNGVLIKMPKPKQDLRIDLPVIGPRTIEHAVKAQIRGIAVGAGHVMIPQLEKTIALADKYGLFLHGFDFVPFQSQSLASDSS